MDPTTAAAAHQSMRNISAVDLYRPLVNSALLVLAMFVVGVAGYQLLGGDEYTLFDAVYMTMITLTTVGYGEVIDMSGNPAARAFTTFLLFGGVGSFIYFFSNVTAFFVEGNVKLMLWRKRMAERIAKLDRHMIVCGGGNTGRHVIAELIATERPFVLIETDETHVAGLLADFGEFPIVMGDASDDDVLLDAGVERAAGLVACVSCDKDNLIVTVSSRLLNPTLRIVCRCVDAKVEAKIIKAGADAVVSPTRIGGLRMVSEMIRPTAVTFLDQMLRDTERRLRVESTLIEPEAELDGKTVQDLRGRDLEDLVVLALLDSDGSWRYNPPADTPLAAGVSVVHCSGPAGRQQLEGLARK